jgi:sulfotransferase
MKWASKYNINMYKTIFGSYPKIICCVRNMEDIIASFNSLYNKNNKKWDLDENIKNIFFDNYNYIKDVYNSNYRKHLLLVHYEDLVQNPEKTLIQLYNFIEEPYYKHDFNSIKINKSFSKVEKIYGMKELHNIKKGLIKSTIDPHNFLSPIQIKKWEEFNFWK